MAHKEREMKPTSFEKVAVNSVHAWHYDIHKFILACMHSYMRGFFSWCKEHYTSSFINQREKKVMKREKRIEPQRSKILFSLKALSCTYCDDGNDSMLLQNETEENSEGEGSSM